jgi:hypothetical protein
LITIITTAFVWLVSIAESIILTVMSFFAVILMLWTFTMAGILADENGQHLYCEKSETGVENCYMREWSIVD